MMYQLTRSVGSIPQFGLKAIIYIAFIIVMIYPTKVIYCDSPPLTPEQTQELQYSLQRAYDNEIAYRARQNIRSLVVTCNDIGIT